MKIVIIEENVSIRRFLKTFLKNQFQKVQIYTSGNGIEGLGLVYVVKPDIILIDSSLPKYSGKSIIDFLVTNARFSQYKNMIILMTNGKNNEGKLELPPNYYEVAKNNSEILNQIYTRIKEFIDEGSDIHFSKKSLRFNYLNRIGISLAHKSDLVWEKFRNKKFWYLIPWLYYQILLSFVLSFHMLLFREVKDANVDQEKIDIKQLRSKAYPTLVGLCSGYFIYGRRCSSFKY